MTHDRRWTVPASMFLTGLLLAGCDDPPDNFIPPGTAFNPPASEPTDARKKVDVLPERKEDRKQGEVAPGAVKRQTRKPLDLSLPAQPTIVPRSVDDAVPPEPVLPDLFEPQQELDDDRSMHLKGRVLMEQGAEQDLKSMEGGQVIFEKKTW